MGALGNLSINRTVSNLMGGDPSKGGSSNPDVQNFIRGGNGYATPQNSPEQFQPQQAQNPYVTQPVRQGELIGASQTPGYSPNPYFGNQQATMQLQQGAYGRNMYAPNVHAPQGNGVQPGMFGTGGNLTAPPPQGAAGGMRGYAATPQQANDYAQKQQSVIASGNYHPAPQRRG